MTIKTNKNFILLGLCAVLAVANVIFTIDGATSGIQISSYQKTEAQLSEQKRELTDELVKTLSISDLQEKSTELGFIKAGDIIYLSQSAPVAKLP